jgi:hypothetical protein
MCTHILCIDTNFYNVNVLFTVLLLGGAEMQRPPHTMRFTPRRWCWVRKKSASTTAADPPATSSQLQQSLAATAPSQGHTLCCCEHHPTAIASAPPKIFRVTFQIPTRHCNGMPIGTHILYLYKPSRETDFKSEKIFQN